MKESLHENGYYRYATIHKDRIVFVCEDDLWEVGAAGGDAKRLSAGRSEFSMPRFSPDGKKIALIAREEGHPEVFVMPSSGGNPVRLSYLGSDILNISGWSEDGKDIYFASDARSAFFREGDAFKISSEGGEPVCWRWGHVNTFMIGKGGEIVIGRNAIDPARWKRYRGGTAGDLWIDPNGKGKFKRLIELKGNLVCPMIIGSRVFFLSDHEGMGNIYSCRPDGKDLKQHTHHTQYYVRFPSTDGNRIVYTAGANIYVLDPKTGEDKRVDVKIPASTHQIRRKFSDARDYLEHFSPHPDGHSVALIARGQPITMGNWEGPPTQHGVGSAVRYRLAEWLPDGKRFIVINDREGFERVEMHHADQSVAPEVVSATEFGRALKMLVSPKGDRVAISNHKHDLLVLDLKTKKLKLVDRSPADRISEFSWSPDGRWIAYAYAPHPQSSIIRIADIDKNSIHNVTDEVRFDTAPAWDPDGRFLYFLGAREFYPVYDSVRFDYGFPKAMKPYLVTLRKDVSSPFVLEPKPVVSGKKKKAAADQPAKGDEKAGEKGVAANSAAGKTAAAKTASTGPALATAKSKTALKKMYKDALAAAYKEILKTVESGGTVNGALAKTDGKAATKGKDTKDPKDADKAKQAPSGSNVQIDFDGIAHRILAFPVAEGRYSQIVGAENRALFTVYSVEGIRPHFSWYDGDSSNGTLMAYDFEEARAGTIQKDIGYMALAFDNQTLYYKTGRRIRAMDAGEKLPAEGREASAASGTGRKSGFLDLSRAQVLVTPQDEWKQMYEESWRLQRDQFGTKKCPTSTGIWCAIVI